MSGAPYRLAADIGGTFTDLVLEEEGMPLRYFKRPTTPDDPLTGLLDAIGAAAAGVGLERRELLDRTGLFVHGTTRATNAVVTANTARTAFFCTAGHPDTLLWREGNDRRPPLDYSQRYPEPYVPRSLTFEIPGRIGADGSVLTPLDAEATVAQIGAAGERDVEAIGVCLLWSIANPEHEQAVGELIAAHLPGVPFTLSHQLNPSIREYRRASSTVIDASVKPLMTLYFERLESALRGEGFGGRLLSLTSSGGVLDADAVARAPIHSIGSGPAAAPVAGRHFARQDAGAATAIVTDAGGTTYDVSLVRDDKIPWTRETTVGDFPGYMLGFPSIDVRSIGAGGGSIAWVDAGGLLHVGPQSAGAQPGPACYGRGGEDPTVTDACLVLGYIDPERFLGGEMSVDADLARVAIERDVATPLGLSLDEAAAAILTLAIEHMVAAIEDITVNQGIDHREAVVVGGGGGAGLYSALIAQRLEVEEIVIPPVAAALSASGALLSELRQSFAAMYYSQASIFDYDGVNRTLEGLGEQCEEFLANAGAEAISRSVEFSVEARYRDQVWEIDVPLADGSLAGEGELEQLCERFHVLHNELFAHEDRGSDIEFITWHASGRCRLREPLSRAGDPDVAAAEARERSAFFADGGRRATPVHALDTLPVGVEIEGPAIAEGVAQSIVLPPGCRARRLESGSLLMAVTAR